MSNFTQRVSQVPVVRWAAAHPRLAAWLVLSVGFVTFLLIEARNVGLLPLQLVAMVVATVLVAGLCVWIISWEDSADELAETDTATATATTETPAVASATETDLSTT